VIPTGPPHPRELAAVPYIGGMALCDSNRAPSIYCTELAAVLYTVYVGGVTLCDSNRAPSICRAGSTLFIGGVTV
jgi:hypothetical protein